MTLTTIPLDQLKLSPLNVRKKGGKEIADLVPSIRSLGLLQPLLVRPNCEGFEIVAGQRRFHALTAIAAEDGAADPVPCIVMAEGDDAKAIEASLAENIARLPMDEIDQYKAFYALRMQGLDVCGIASRFGVTERLVSQRLAIAGIIEPILNAYRRDEIGAETLRILTMATPRQQKAWWKLFRAEDEYAPTGRLLKDWLFGGAQIPVANALFALEAYDGALVSDLFGDERYFADADAFWRLQNEAVAAKRDAYLADGWAEVILLDVGQRFAAWEHRKAAKKKGGKVFVAITADGEVTVHEGWLSEKEAKRKEKAEHAEAAGGDISKPDRSELTKTMRNYLGLHKHAAVRTELLSHPFFALRLTVAHMIAGSGLWTVSADEQKADNAAIGESLSSAKAGAEFEAEREAVRGLLGQDAEEPGTIAASRHGYGAAHALTDIFITLLGMEDASVLRILAFVMAETLQAHTEIVETLGMVMGTDMLRWWTPDQTFFDLLRDKQAINAMLRDVAGDITADAHRASTAKVQKTVVADCLSGHGRAKVEGWLPPYMMFPEGCYGEPKRVCAAGGHHPSPDDSDIADAA